MHVVQHRFLVADNVVHVADAACNANTAQDVVLLCFHAGSGDVVQWSVSGSNTGNLRIKSLILQVAPNLQPDTFSCIINGSPYDPSAPVVVAPGGQGSCSGTYTIKLPDIEAGPQNITVVLQGVSAQGDQLRVERSVLIIPVIERNLTARVLVEQCSRPNATGKWFLPWYHTANFPSVEVFA